MNENAKNEHEKTAGLRNPSAEDRFHSVQIGGQEWMAGNLDVGTFLNGDSINLVQEGREWEHCARNAIPAMCWYTGHEDDGGTDFGALYNWYAVDDSRGLAPAGWHVPTDNEIKEREVEGDELAHYSKRTVDFEYEFPFGVKELYGLAYRTDFDLKNHSQASGVDLVYTDEEGKKVTPHVIEPTWGVERSVLAALVSAYTEEKMEEDDTRVVLKLPKWLAPIKVAVLPLSKKEELAKPTNDIFESLLKVGIEAEYDETQSIGKRYRRQDEIGTPYCVTVDFDSLSDKAVTVRDRDTMKQERIKINKLEDYLKEKLIS